MFRIFLRLAVVVSAVLVSACAATNPEIPFDRSTASDVKRIGIIEPAFPDHPSVIVGAGVEQYLGTLGMLADAGLRTDHETALTKLLADRKYDAKARFLQALRDALHARGYETVDIPATRSADGFIADFGFARGQPVDAYLDVVVANYGFAAASLGDAEPYRPMIYLDCRLVSAKDPCKVLMLDEVLFNPLNTLPNAIVLSPPADYSFKDFPALTAGGDRVTQALDVAFTQTSQAAGTVLK